MEQQFDKYALVNDMRQSLDQLADAKGTLRCGLIWHLNNLFDTLNRTMQDEDKAHEQKVKEVWKLAQEGKGGGQDDA